MPTALIVLAAGQGTRMNSDLPKVLHSVAGAPLLIHALKSGAGVMPERTVVVAGHGADEVRKAAQAWDETVEIVIQEKQLGTGHAVMQARQALDGFDGDAIVLYGDTPFIKPETLQKMTEARSGSDIVVLGFEPDEPGRYGRLVTDGESLERIVEYKDATPVELRIRLCNSGVVAANARTLFEVLDKTGNDNAAGEYYLTDVVFHARQAGLSASVVRCDEAETIGVDSRADIARAERFFQTRARAEALETGVTLQDPETVIFAHDTVVGRDATVEPYVVFGAGVTVESGATIRAFSHIEGAHVSRGAVVGPFARLRPGAELAEDVRIGNFVEVKNAQFAEGAKANHLTYVGDATVGAGANLGAGTVTCNYDGVHKHHTEIGAQAFIGSSTMLVAPVKIGADAMTASGSVITKDVPEGDLAVGRARQVNKSGFARRLFDKLKKSSRK